MATNDPSTRLTSSSPNGVTEQRGNGGGTTAGTGAPQSDMGRRADETPGERIGRFFRRAMDRLSGDDEDQWRRGNERNERDRDTRDRYRAGDRSWQHGPPYGQGQGSYGESNVGGYERDDMGLGVAGQGRYSQSQGSPGQGPSFESRGGPSFGQRGPGRNPGDRSRPGESGLRSDPGRDDWNRGDWNRGDTYRGDWTRGDRDRWGERSWQSGGAGASYGFGRDQERMGEWGETARDRDRGQGRRFWQREPLAARDVMTRNPKAVTRQSAHRDAAAIMRDENCGVVPVVDAAGRLEGILTDRDIVVRGIAHDRALELRVEDVMTDDVSAVTEDEPLTSVLDLMGRKQIRRVPVVDRDDRLLGIISMADIANRADYDEDLQDAFDRISSRRSFWSLFS
jgi:CBS domain-containing protein